MIKAQNIKDIFLILTFLASLIISAISNYSYNSFVLKAMINLILLIFIYFDYKQLKKKKGISYRIDYKLILIILLLIILPAITLIYTKNLIFGFEKLLYLIIGTIPLILASNYLLKTFINDRFYKFIEILVVICIVGVISSLILKPFQFGTLYKFSLENWSHVIFGRFIAATSLIIFMLSFNTDGKRFILLSSITILLVFGTFYSGLRAASIGITIFMLIFYIYSLYKKKLKTVHKIFPVFIFLMASILIIISFKNNKVVEQRFENMTDFNQLTFNEDAAIGARIEAYKISIERFEKHPIIGLGFGGFRTYYKSDLPIWIKYPHNIFLEALVETGIIGFILFIYLLIMVYKKLYKISFELFLFFIFSLWLAMFSKDIPTNSMLLIGIAFIGIDSGFFRNLELKFLKRF